MMSCFVFTEKRDRRCFTPIHCAAQSGNVDVVVALLSGGSEANSRGFAGTTPLHISVSIMLLIQSVLLMFRNRIIKLHVYMFSTVCLLNQMFLIQLILLASILVLSFYGSKPGLMRKYNKQHHLQRYLFIVKMTVFEQILCNHLMLLQLHGLCCYHSCLVTDLNFLSEVTDCMQHKGYHKRKSSVFY